MGQYLVTTRPMEKPLTKSYEGCFEVINVPVTSLEPNDAFNASEISVFDPDIAVFTSSYGVDLYFDRFRGDFSSKVSFVSIGNETAKALRKWGKESKIPEKRTSEGVMNLISGSEGKKVALFVSSKSNGIIQSYLEKQSIEHIVGVLYRAEALPGTEIAEKALHKDCFGLIITSSFEAREIFQNHLDKDQMKRLCAEKKIFAIGKTTERELQSLGIHVSAPVGKSDLGKLLEEINKKYCGNK